MWLFRPTASYVYHYFARIIYSHIHVCYLIVGSGRDSMTIEDMGSYHCKAVSTVGAAEHTGNFTVNILCEYISVLY